MKGRDLLSVNDLNPDELEHIIRTALSFKRDGTPQVLAGKTIAMLFEKPSLRTRVSFEVGMKQLGGTAIYLSQAEVGLGQREPVQDVGRVLSRYVAGIVVRTYAQQSLVDLAAAADIPVINALSDDEHPCQALADLLTIREKKGRLDGVRLAFIGDGNNVSASLALAAALAGVEFVIAAPDGYALPPAVVDACQEVGPARPAAPSRPRGAGRRREGRRRRLHGRLDVDGAGVARARQRQEAFTGYQVDGEPHAPGQGATPSSCTTCRPTAAKR